MTLAAILQTFDERNDDFFENEIATSLHNGRAAGDLAADNEDHIWAEINAFRFHEDAHAHEWGTYYGPYAVFPMQGGGKREIPALHDVSSVAIDRWVQRSSEARHPQMRGRYADLVWDFTARVTGTKPDVQFARIVVDSAIELAAKPVIQHGPLVRTKLRRALELSLRLNDEVRLGAVRQTILVFEDRHAEDGKVGTWGFAYDLLVEVGNAKLPPDDEQRIIARLEDRLTRLSSAAAIDPFAVKHAALRLAAYYRKHARLEDMKRVVRAYSSAFTKLASQASALVGSAWKGEVLNTFIEYGMKEDADQVQQFLGALHRRTPRELSVTRHETGITEDDVRVACELLIAPTLDETLDRIARDFLIDRDRTEQQVREMARTSPIQAIFHQVFLDAEGRPEAEIGSIEDDLDGHVVAQMRRLMEFGEPWLRMALSMVQQRFSPTADQWCAYIFKAPLFEAPQRPLVLRGFDGFVKNDAIVVGHVLVPQIEQALRRLATLLGRPYLRPARNGGFHLRLLDDLLRDSHVELALSKRVTKYLQVVLTDQRGLNLRNAISHGYLSAGAFGPLLADRLVHALLVIAQTRARPTGQTPSDELPSE